MSEQQPEPLWYCGVYDDDGLDYFEPATKENSFFAIRRAEGLKIHGKHPKAFTAPIHLMTETAILDLLEIGEIQYAKLIVQSLKDIQYVK